MTDRAKVNDLHVEFEIENDVLVLDVAMHNVMLVQMGDASHNLNGLNEAKSNAFEAIVKKATTHSKSHKCS